MSFQDSLWNISMSRLVILAARFWDIVRKKQTDKQTNVAEYPAPVTTVGVDNQEFHKITSHIVKLLSHYYAAKSLKNFRI